MAGSSSSSGGLCNYDVFLSFRGEDTRKNFVCHLHRALVQKTIKTFIDSEDLDKGSRISELLKAIEESRLSIVVLSENYASSSWCLKELVKILECMDTNNQIVVPIFYQVDPSHIRNLNGKFGQAFANKFGGADKQELESWRSALAKVADLSGWDSTKYEDDDKLIEKIVKDTWKKWIHNSSSQAPGLVGMDFHIQEMSLRLCPGEKDARVVGIWGMGGIGKTTIARAVYGEIACQFDHTCFLDNVKEAFRNKREVQMQEELLYGLLNEKVKSVGLTRGRNMIMQRLGKKRVLVVLDDVETVAHIRDLLGNPHSFGPGSRIIITTRNKQSLSEDDELYEPKHLSDDEALKLFTTYAFGEKSENQPTGDYNHLSRRAIEYAQGLPLALKILGGSLYNRTERQWEVMLDKLQEIPHIKIMDVLKTSIEELDHSQKNTFLDIACFFRGVNNYLVTDILDSCGFFPNIGLSVLEERALITISDGFDGEWIDMHDLLQEMGREMVCQDPRGRSRLWSYEDVVRVLTQRTDTEAVECIILDLSNSEMDLWIDSGAFVKMRKLRLLMIYYNSLFENWISEDWYYGDDFCNDDYFCNEDCFCNEDSDKKEIEIEYVCPSNCCKQLGRGDFEFLSHELRFLVWHGCPLKSLPSNFNPKNLVRLDMRCSRIEQLWEGTMPLKNLKVILLSYCKYLIKTPDLTGATNLERLVLDGCSSLNEVHLPILALQNLLAVSLQRCKKLKIFPSSIHMKSLLCLDLSGCSNLDKFPDIAEVMEKLTRLHLCGTAIKELPSSIKNLTGLQILNLSGCRELKILPSLIAMKSLWKLDLSGCSNLDKFPEIDIVMKELWELKLSETSIKELPSSINNLTGLQILDLTGCRELKILPSLIAMKSLWKLDLSGCSNLDKFPEIAEVMKTLKELTLSETAIKELPSSFERLQGLLELRMTKCRSLVCLPDSICNLAHLRYLDLSGCSKLSSLPENMKTPCSAWASSSISSLFQNFHQHTLNHLAVLDLSDCHLLELSESIAHLSSLESLNLCRNNFKSLPATMNRLGRLRILKLEACDRLKSIPELSSSVEYIDAHDCISLETVSEPKPQYHTEHFFTFSNCFQLQTNLFSDIVDRHSHFQDNCLRRLRLKMSLPGAEVPDWFDHRSRGFSVSLQLPPNWFDSKFLGFAICAVRTSWGTNYHISSLSAACLCTFKGSFGKCSFSFDLLNSVFRINRSLWSDHMFLGYVPWSECPLSDKERLVNETCYTEATFMIVVESKFKTEQLQFSQKKKKQNFSNSKKKERTEQLRITSCGVRLVFANQDEMLNLSKAQPQFHADSCETGVSFMDPCETERTEIIEVSSEVESSVAGEGRDTCHRLLLSPVFSELGSHSGLPVPEPQVREKERGTCHRLQLFPELSELGSHSGLPESEPQAKENERDTCHRLQLFPEISEVMMKLNYLYLDETAIKELPSSIERFQGLKSVSMRNCRSLVCLPDSICNLAHLTFLDLSGCSKLSSLPENIGSLNSLTELEVQDSGIKQLPFSLSHLRELRISLSRNGLNAMKIPISAWWSSISLSQHTDHVRHLDLSDCHLLELSEGIAHLYSLESLKLCRNNFESLPATMNRLGRLRDLRLDACDRLKSIPELSSTINYIDAHDCISLETVSKPKPQYHTKHFFTFSNCFQLVQTNLFRDIVERHSHIQDNCLRPLWLKMSLPGDEVPDWFQYQSRGFSVSVQLPPNWFDSKFLGFAICAVRTRWGINYHTSPLSAACLCTFKGNFGECSFNFDLLDSVFRIDRSLSSDHMFLGYVPWSECPLIEEGRLVNETYYTEATFKIVVESEFTTEQLRITSCGVSLVYANQDEMLNLSMAQPQFHVDGCETVVAFMSPCEMRNKETERAEITEVSREVESSEAGEGRDTCHTLQLFPEQQMERKGEKEIMEMTEQEEGEGCRMLRSVCCCLSLSGCNYCNMSLRKKETEREGGTITGVSGNGELSELGSHSGLQVPEPQSERKEEKESMEVSVMEEESAVGRGLLGPLCRRAVQLFLLAGCTMVLKVIKNRNRGL